MGESRNCGGRGGRLVSRVAGDLSLELTSHVLTCFSVDKVLCVVQTVEDLQDNDIKRAGPFFFF